MACKFYRVCYVTKQYEVCEHMMLAALQLRAFLYWSNDNCNSQFSMVIHYMNIYLISKNKV